MRGPAQEFVLQRVVLIHANNVYYNGGGDFTVPVNRNFSVLPDVTIGFERTSYTEREDGGSVRVCAVVTDGGFLIPVMVRVNSIDGSATSQGEYVPVLAGVKSSIFYSFTKHRLFSVYINYCVTQ